MSGSEGELNLGTERLRKACLLFLYVCIAILWNATGNSAGSDVSTEVILFEIKGAISPAVNDYLAKGLEKARDGNADLIILQMDTPGGLDTSMRDIIKNILASPIPVITYVAPEGARAASAGTYILYASHVAAMSPATNLGAATPISIGGLPGSSDPPGKQKDKDNDQLPTNDAATLKRKVINDATAYIRSLAERHGRNADWAEEAVRSAVSLSAQEALDLGVIDFIAGDAADLLDQIDGHLVMMDSGTHVITSHNAVITTIAPTWRYRVLSVISDPNVAYLLLLLGFYGLIYELANPGVFLPGVAGTISLLLALYAFQILPINYSGFALMILGLLFMVSEAFIPSFGSLGIGGVVAFAVGSMILMDDENLRVSLSLIASTTAVSVLLLIVLVGRVIVIRKKKIRTGEEALIGMIGEASEDFEGEGRMWLLGESWIAKSTEAIGAGDRLKVISRKGLELNVERTREEP